ncbi:MAG TPA: NADH-quinone oxidoreductase subunit C [Candidatus Krumholzibacteriaceae bacterium]|nr:NADH-quinone oxidoreductase subunit C [Candidatus Krumholzibacteriaceae bacterium]
MEREHEIIEKLQQFLKEDMLESSVPRDRRIFVNIKREALEKAIEFLVNDLEFKHLSTITGSDLGETLELIYHLANKGSIELSLRITIPESKAVVPTITDSIPGAVLYEREVHEMLGVMFEGHPDLLPLILPEGWPQNVYPLRKEEKFEDLRKIGSK